jgi:hypothetical protein
MGRMTLAREELVLFALVLLATGFLAYGVVELTWPRARARGPQREKRPRYPSRPRPPVPRRIVPPMVTPEPPATPPLTLDEILDQVGYLADFPLRALVLLRRAEAQIAGLPGEATRSDLRRRLGTARAMVGGRLVDAGLVEQALAPLTQVVSGNGLAGDDLQRAREAFITALTTVTEQRASAIRSLAQDGNQAAAITHAERLATLLRSAVDIGLTEAELAGALANAQRLFVQLGVHRVVVARASR